MKLTPARKRWLRRRRAVLRRNRRLYLLAQVRRLVAAYPEPERWARERQYMRIFARSMQHPPE